MTNPKQGTREFAGKRFDQRAASIAEVRKRFPKKSKGETTLLFRMADHCHALLDAYDTMVEPPAIANSTEVMFFEALGRLNEIADKRDAEEAAAKAEEKAGSQQPTAA